jgi:hypothetical protein
LLTCLCPSEARGKGFREDIQGSPAEPKRDRSPSACHTARASAVPAARACSLLNSQHDVFLETVGESARERAQFGCRPLRQLYKGGHVRASSQLVQIFWDKT